MSYIPAGKLSKILLDCQEVPSSILYSIPSVPEAAISMRPLSRPQSLGLIVVTVPKTGKVGVFNVIIEALTSQVELSYCTRTS